MTARHLSLFAPAFGLLLLASQASPIGQQPDPDHHGPAHVVVEPAAIEWGPAPPALPSGAEFAVVHGDPAEAGAPFVIRAKMPDGYTIAPHWHPTTEHLTVLEGTFMVGLGDTFDEAALKTVPTGGFASMPKETNHFAKAKGETTLQIHGMGPFDLTYVDPEDDPRNKTE